MSSQSTIVSPLDGILPAVVSVAVFLLGLGAARLLFKSRDAAKRMSWIEPLAAVAGVLSVYKSIMGVWPSFPPGDAKHWTLWILVGGAVLWAVVQLARLGAAARVGIAGAMTACGVWLTLRPLISSDELLNVGFCIALSALFTVVLLLLQRRLDRSGIDSTGRLDRLLIPVALIVAPILVGVLLILSGSVILGRLSIALAGASGVPFLARLLRSRDGAPEVVTPFVTLPVIVMLIIAGRWYSELSGISMTLVSLVPVIASLGLATRIGRFPSFVRCSIRLSLLMLPIVVAIAVAAPKYVREMNEASSVYGGE